MSTKVLHGGSVHSKSATRSWASIKIEPLLGMSEFLFLIRPTFVNLSQIIHLPFFRYLLMLVIVGIIAPFIVYAVVFPKKVLKIDSVLLVLFNALFFFVSLTFHPEYEPLLFSKSAFRNGINVNIYDKIFNPINYTILVAYVLFRADDSPKHVVGILSLCGRVKFLMLFWQGLFPIDYMTFGYDIALTAVFLFVSYIVKNSKLDIILSIIAIIEGFLLGNRGCVLGYAALVLIYFFALDKRKITWKKVVIILLVVVGYFALSSETFISTLMGWMGNHGFSSRTLRLLISGEVAVDNSRMKIWSQCLEAISKHSIVYGYGAYGDRYILWGGRYYAHNMILEILIDFGFIFGVLFIGIAVYYMIRGWLKSDLYGKASIAALGSFSIMRLMFSSSFWYEPTLYAMLALCVTATRRKRQPQRRMNPPTK